MVSDAPTPALFNEDPYGALSETLGALRDDADASRALLGLSAALGEVRSVADTLDIAVQMVPEMLDADRCFVATWDRARDNFMITARWGYPPEAGRILDETADGEGFPVLRRSLLGDKVPVMIEDAAAFPLLQSPEQSHRNLGAYIGIPLLRRGEELGVLAVEYLRPRGFSVKQHTLVHSIGRQVSVALANARRFALLQELRTLGLRLGRVLRLAPVMDEVLAGAQRLLSGDAAGLYLADSTRSELISASRRGDGATADFPRIRLSEEPWSGLTEGLTIQVPASAGVFQPHGGEPQSVVATPLLGAGTPVVGAILVFFDRSLTLGNYEIEALEVLAAQSAMAIENAQRFERRRSMARSLQSGLLATDVRDIPGCSIGTIYEPATDDSEVGGDFFDVFDLSDDHIGIVVGDVSGKGAEAAAITAQAKYMLRAFANRNASPSSGLFHLNNALERSLDDDRFATAMFATIDPATRSGHVAVAGHPAPLIYRAANGTVESFAPKGGLLGAFPDEQFDQESFVLDEGDVFMACTDGLIEARRGNDLYGPARVEKALALLAPLHTGSDLARAIYQDAQEFGVVRDDTVVFTIAFEGPL